MMEKDKECPECGGKLHQFEDHKWGCDNCQQVYTLQDLHAVKEPPRKRRDVHGNPEMPDEIL